MALTRLTLLACLFAATVLPDFRPDTPVATPDGAPAPFAESRATDRFWPVITNHERALDVSALYENGASTGAVLRRFNAPRPAARASNPTRRHVGVDLFANPGDGVIAIEAGRIIAFYPFLRARTGEMSYALLVAHDGYVANYGEIRANALEANHLAIGDEVEAGQRIGEISDTAQLHVETYAEGTTHGHAWPHGAPAPANVMNPTALLVDLTQTGERRR
jgi:murein DD-endopeptidase MepM/ murein hydrolase activator NlpD